MKIVFLRNVILAQHVNYLFISASYLYSEIHKRDVCYVNAVISDFIYVKILSRGEETGSYSCIIFRITDEEWSNFIKDYNYRLTESNYTSYVYAPVHQIKHNWKKEGF